MTTSARDAAVSELVHRRHRRQRARLVTLLAAIAVVTVTGLGVGIVQANTRAPERAPDRLPATVSDDKAGLLASRGPVRVDVYVDFLCPECRRTEQALGTELKTLEQEGRAAVVYHPVAFLDDLSAPRGYSTRGAAAAACAADLGRFEQYAAVLFRRQPVERGPGLGTDALITAGKEAGITATTFDRCVRDGRYLPWVAYVSETAAAHQVTVTPTVLVDGRRLDVTGADPATALVGALQGARR